MKLNHRNGGKFEGGMGFVWEGADWGCMGCFTHDLDEKVMFHDKGWWNKGPLSVSCHGKSSASNLTVNSVNMDV